ncbi:aminoacetone oxidase family FAD-binding enzyme, partial [Acinetobacter baumannii]
FLMDGKTGLNISHAEPLPQFIESYDHAEWLKTWVEKWDAAWIQNWMKGLGIDSYVGSSGRIFHVEMKEAPLLSSWLKRLAEK